MTTFWLALCGFLIWFSILVLPWRPWSTRESLDAHSCNDVISPSVSVLIPARNEEEVIFRTLSSLADQSPIAQVILINDQSEDKTVDLARQSECDKLTIIEGRPLKQGWSGKLWALEQGREKVTTEYTLLLDADIELQADTVATLVKKLEKENLDMVSLMAYLRMQSVWELLLMPAFIYFFKLLYPFALANSRNKLIAAAAGGCILIKSAKLEEIGGFAALKEALIDDCSLARLVKKTDGRTWLGLSHSAISHRSYDKLETIWDMVARTAYTQLHYSLALLLLCTLLMLFAFVVPLASMFVMDLPIILISVLAYIMMMISYLPVLKYYQRNPLWACTLPITGVLYLCMTWSSAIRHWRGTGAVWKNRAYARPAP
ncbi:MAG: glycosyltransferase [Gammaproteobacteria bacterium]|nr:glycosyltransferase [Gammaproteobacteria bacterium]